MTSTGTTTTLTKYFSGPSALPTAEWAVRADPLGVLASDGQGTVSTALDGAGNVTSQQLYTPYGNARYSSGSSPTTLGYTGQRADSSTGLDYYQARYYDPVAGQFTSADTANDGSNRYEYVAGNPETATDPTGHYLCLDDPCTRGGGKPSAPPPPPPCTGNASCSGNGGSGGNGGTGGGNTVSCRINPEPVQDLGASCYSWRQWRDNVNDNIRSPILGAMRHDAGVFIGIGLAAIFSGAIVELFGKSDPLIIVEIVVSVLEAGIDAFGVFSSITPENAAVDFDVLAKLSAALTMANTILGLVHGMATWMYWTLEAALAAVKITVAGLGELVTSLIFSAIGSGIQAVGQASSTIGYMKLRDAAQQERMNTWDWCNGPGKGKCPSEPNGGMPIN